MNLAPLDATFGATVTDINLTDLDDGQFQVLYNTWLQYSLLIFPAQHLDSEQVGPSHDLSCVLITFAASQ